MEQSSAFIEEQRHATRMLILAATLCCPAITAIAFLTDASVLPVAVCTALAAALGWALSRFDEDVGRIGAGLAITAQSLLLVVAFTGHGWQMDSHLMIVAALIVVSTLLDIRALLISTAVVLVHHVGLALLAPSLAFDTTDIATSLERTALHGGAVILACVILLRGIKRHLGMDQQNTERAAEAAAALERAQTTEADAITARRQAENERQAAVSEAQKAEQAAKAIHAETEARKAAEATAETQRQDAARAEVEEREKIDRVVSSLRSATNALARGNLNVRLREEFPPEFQDLRADFNFALDSLDTTFSGIHSNTDLIRDETNDIAASAERLSKRTETQAQTLEALSHSMDELSGLISSAAHEAKQAETVVLGSRTGAENSKEVMNTALAAMNEIEATSAEVRKISTVIDDIAFQTNLLALNAGVEAARAGHAGRGFAVVASEVRALARRSSEAASQINGLIGQSAAQIQRGVALVRDTGVALEDIIASVTQASERMVQIAGTSADQAEGIGKVNVALRDLDTGAQENAAMFEETTSACVTLRSSAQALSSSLDVFASKEPIEQRQSVA